MNDSIGRLINYLRISVTDRCNYRCVYCMPPDGINAVGHSEIMRFEEILKVVRVAADYGVSKIRLTGGEPLVRHGIVDLVRMIRKVPGINEITLTTNGYLLAKYARELKEAGLTRVNISLDTLDPDLFRKITRNGDINSIWEGIEAVEKNGLHPLKINMVMLAGINDHEIPDFMDLTLENEWHVRFIELMPIKNQISWGELFPDPASCYISTRKVLERFQNKGLKPVYQVDQIGPAKLYQIPGAKGYVGFISPVDDEHFCGSCNRLRLTADGNLRPCLMSDLEIPVLDAIRSEKDIHELFARVVKLKPAHHELLLNHSPENRTMTQIGG
ncbi:MAG: GTP 3',8-cyclase MoaA [Chloroflexi bacterium HGW-Chloroflexi-10]|nr:MAG: GTP 3',8-cyclase MoaA [Chloroflexi bacterium HGW-Chloroflexi-10]